MVGNNLHHGFSRFFHLSGVFPNGSRTVYCAICRSSLLSLPTQGHPWPSPIVILARYVSAVVSVSLLRLQLTIFAQGIKETFAIRLRLATLSSHGFTSTVAHGRFTGHLVYVPELTPEACLRALTDEAGGASGTRGS